MRVAACLHLGCGFGIIDGIGYIAGSRHTGSRCGHCAIIIDRQCALSDIDLNF